MILNKISQQRLQACDPILQLLAIEAAKESPYEFVITCGMRTIAEQQKLFAQGRTIPGKKVTNCDGVIKKSKHNYSPSKAFDFAVIINGELTWDEKYYNEMGEHFKKTAINFGLKISWGGDWKKFKDKPHIEIP